VRDLRELRAPAGDEQLADFETDVLASFVLARASAGLVDSTIRNDTNHLELIRDWFGGRCGRWSRRTPTPTSATVAPSVLAPNSMTVVSSLMNTDTVG